MDKRFITAAVALAVGMLAIGAPAAAADIGVRAVTQAEEDFDYAPDEPTEPTLAGSSVVPECAQDVPWITYTVRLTDPDALATSRTARLVLSDGTNTVTLTLGELGPDNSLTGRILWPGASVDGEGNGTGWPGWAYEGGEWVTTPGNYAWTRQSITATLEVNPTLPVALSYPPSSPICLTDPPGKTSALAATGGDAGAAVVIGVVGVSALAAGALAFALRRRRDA